MDILQDKLRNYVLDPKNPKYNFQLAKAYEDIYHTASAAGYYLRVTEYSRDNTEIYEALLRMALCFRAQGNRVFTVTGLLMRAIALIPDRPEGYYLLCQVYEQNEDWQEAYTWSVVGERVALNNYTTPLPTDVRYPGRYGFIFERAVAAWWIGRYDESLHLLRGLSRNSEMYLDHVITVQQNLEKLENVWKPPMLYTNHQHETLRVKFPGSDKIDRNHSQCFQDLFVLTMLDGKTDGRYLEIGCGEPWYGNNTALLGKLGWTGISVDIVPDTVDKFNAERGGAILGDATRMKFEELLSGTYDYLQIDCDPAQTSLQTLFNIPFQNNRFRVITFEHDHYLDESDTVRNRSRQYLKSLGYIPVVMDVSVNDFDSFEDWWIHPALISDRALEIVNQMNQYNSDPNRADIVMFH